jgi:MFS family permease
MLFTAGLVSLLIALNQGHAWGWSAPRTLGLLTAAVTLLAVFISVELHIASPMLDLSLFRDAVFSASTASALLNYICVYSVLFVLPFLLIQGRGLDARHAGLVLTAQPLVMAIVAPLSGSMSDRIGSRVLATLGMGILAIGLAAIGAAAASSLVFVVAGLAVVGLGVGLFVSPNNSALMGAAPRNRQGIASGVLASARNVGMVLGVGISGAVFTTILGRGGAGALTHGVRTSLFVAAAIAALGTLLTFVGRAGGPTKGNAGVSAGAPE